VRGSLNVAPARTQAAAGILAQQALACTFFAALIAVFARISIYVPFTPVPFTLQPMAIMLAGLFLGSGPAFFALLEYLAAGAMGAPVFAGGNGGFAYMAATPTLGYLASYPVAAYVVGRIAEGSRLQYARLLLAALAGLAIIYIGGNAYLSFWLHKGALPTLLAGAVPFIAFDVVKAVLAAGVASSTAASWFGWRRR
jgi:biotin transport system substrate-specific component